MAQKLYEDLRNPETKLNQKRADLWALGNIGLSDFGMTYLNSIDGLVEDILSMVTDSEHLPLKGVCLNVANMFAQTNMGRQLLKEHSWQLNLLKQNELSESEFICIPPSIESFLSIPKNKKTEPFQLKDEYWSYYYEQFAFIKEKLDDREKEFVDQLMRIPNRISNSKPINIIELTQQNKLDPSILKNTRLFYLILMMLTFYNFPIGIRKNYYSIIDLFLNVPNFLVMLDENRDFDHFLKI